MADPFDDFGIPVQPTTAAVPQLPRRSTAKTPAEDPTNWMAPLFGPHRPPGKWKITGERSRRIDQPEKKGKNNDALIDQGIARGEVNFEVETYTGQQYRDLHDFYDQYLSPDRPLIKANVTTIAYPALYVRGVKQVYGFKASFPVPRSEKGDSPMVSTFSTKVFNAGTRIGGGGGSRKPKVAAGASGNGLTIDDLVLLSRNGQAGLGVDISDIVAPLSARGNPDIAQALAELGIKNAAAVAPVYAPPLILPFKEQSALAAVSKSVPDQMLVDVTNARAPR